MTDTSNTAPGVVVPQRIVLPAVLLAVGCALVAGPLAAVAGPAAAEVAPAGVEGHVMGPANPIAAATVYAYEMASYTLSEVLTDRRGRYRFATLPVGVYKIIATKQGFVPAVELLLRKSVDAHQIVHLRLEEDRSGDLRQAESYWDARRRIPADVLREIGGFPLTERSLVASTVGVPGASLLEARMTAAGGVAELAHGEARMATAEVGMRGTLGPMAIGLEGLYQQLAPSDENAVDGQLRSLSLHLESPQASKLSLLGSRGHLAGLRDDGSGPVDLEHYQLRWSGPAGSKGSSAFSTGYTLENNYYLAGWLAPAEIPETSRTWNFEGSYSRQLGATSLRTGLSYRQRTAGETDLDPVEDEAVNLYGFARSRIQPRVLVEYGLFSSMRQGALALMPRGGLVIRLGSEWQARTSVARRLEREDQVPDPWFATAFYNDVVSCQQVAEACYEVTLTRGPEGEESFSLGAVHRKFAETLRLYFSDDFFNRLESLFVVRGDAVPELRFQVARRISPRILARLVSNLASGGGGIFYATDNLPYENQVRYLVTSLDTQFQQTSTGVFVAFHHLEQSLSPLDGEVGESSDLEIQRLQVMLTQDLSILADVASGWAVRLNMELSRGATPFSLTPDDEMHRLLTGGISVSF